LGLLVFFDIVGSGINDLFFPKKKEENRIVSWLLGFGFFIFCWFLIGLVVPPVFINILISIVVITVIFLPNYISQKKYLSLFKEIWRLKIPFLIIVLFLPAVFIKASLPPYYWDEMAYQFISPSTLQSIGKWQFTGDLYGDLPRTLNTFFLLVFSLTKTYSIARLFHFAILATSMLFAYKSIKKNFGFWPALLFVAIFFSIPQDIVFTSTLGYVDVAAYSFLLIGLLSMVDYLQAKDNDALLLSAIFWSLSLGVKYTALTAFGPSLLLLLFILIIKKQKNIINYQFFSKLIVLSIIFGGFWYLKNLIVFANPLFPFYFPCRGVAKSVCPASSTFFDGWTYKISFDNIRPILGSLFNKGYAVFITLAITPILMFFNKNRRITLTSLFLIGSIFLEFIILKFTSGFMIRYHQHIQLFLLLLIVIQHNNVYKNVFIRKASKYLFAGLCISTLVLLLMTVKYTNSLKFLRWDEINYALGNINIYSWTNERFPNVNGAVNWCDRPPEGKRMPLAQIDPDMIWYKDDGLMRVFMTNCYYENPPLNGIPLNEVLFEAKILKLQFYNATPNNCVEENDIKPFSPSEKPAVMDMRKLNNLLICNSQKVAPGLYYFDYKNIKY
jgi:hypothetical protein